MSKTDGQQRRTLVEEETEFKGTMTSKCPIDVMGKVDGEIEAPSMHVSPSGSVAGTIVVAELHSEGELAGEIDADSVQLSGRVKDGTVIRAKSLEVKLSREVGKMELVFGETELSVGDEPDKEAAVAAAKAGDEARPAAKAAGEADEARVDADAKGDKAADKGDAEAKAKNGEDKKADKAEAADDKKKGRKKSASQSPPPA